MKYYLYISDAKIDMLYPQVPHDVKQRVNTEFGMDLKLVKASRKTEKDTEENRFTKLDAVAAFLQESGNVGSLEEPGEYVLDTLPMRFAPWGRIGRGTHLGSPEFVDSTVTQFVCFAGTMNRFRVILWGSWKHMLGNTDKGEVGQFSNSTSLATFAVWDLIDRLDPDVEWRKNATQEEHQYLDRMRARANEWRDMRVNAFATPGEKVTPVLAGLVNHELQGPEQNLEFLAKRFHYFSTPQLSSFLGTPLYVALVD